MNIMLGSMEFVIGLLLLMVMMTSDDVMVSVLLSSAMIYTTCEVCNVKGRNSDVIVSIAIMVSSIRMLTLKMLVVDRLVRLPLVALLILNVCTVSAVNLEVLGVLPSVDNGITILLNSRCYDFLEVRRIVPTTAGVTMNFDGSGTSSSTV